MASYKKREYGNCQIEESIVNGKRYFKCKNLKRTPTAQEIIESLRSRK